MFDVGKCVSELLYYVIEEKPSVQDGGACHAGVKGRAEDFTF